MIEWPDNLTVIQAAEYLNVSKRHVYDLVADGKIPHFHVGRLTRIPRAELDARLVNAHRHTSNLIPAAFQRKVTAGKR